MNWTWKDELESRAGQFDATALLPAEDRQLAIKEAIRWRNAYAEHCTRHLAHRLRRSERWSDALLWFFLASLFGNILQFWN